MNNKSNEEKFVKRPPRKTSKKKVCQFCIDRAANEKHDDYIDYKDVAKLRKYILENGKIAPRRQTGVCQKHQRHLTTAIKRARCMALLPFCDSIRNDK